MKNSLSLSINTPCSEKWENFSPVHGGGFCSSCTKVVVDFTKMSDDEIVDYFTTHRQASTCGKFRPTQLKQYPILAATSASRFTFLKAGFISALLLLAARPTEAQVNRTKPQTEVVYKKSDNPSAKVNDGHIVSGTVKDTSDGEGLPGVNVVLKGQAVGTVTDADGKFTFPEKLDAGDVLVFSFIGLTTVEYQVQETRDAQIEIPMVCMAYDIMGKVAVNDAYTEKSPFFKRMWWKVKGLF